MPDRNAGSGLSGERPAFLKGMTAGLKPRPSEARVGHFVLVMTALGASCSGARRKTSKGTFRQHFAFHK